eukprot:m.6009 g.6009  ORF g.6009 m.6009 type:complete len:673 (+) comp3461_c0_seq1:13-2031(+)
MAAITILLCVSAFLATTSASPKALKEAEDACNSMNLSTKLEIMHGFGLIDGYSRNSGCGYTCGRKTFRWDNGPQGFGDNTPPGTSTQWPCTLAMASTFDPNLAYVWGQAMGEEFWGKGTNIQEGPGINVARIMKNGRNFEYVSGEDPVLGMTMVQPIVKGIQEHVMSISKHYILNNQETDRSGGNSVIDEVTMMELYAPPFAAAASTTSGYMCSYNRVNGVYACENAETLRTMLKGYFNFSGFVVSDWGACHSTVPSILNGLDIEMPEGRYFTPENIMAALAAKNITTDNIQESCTRVISSYFAIPEDKRHPCNNEICIQNNVSTPEHKELARNISAMATVLLKNDGAILPLKKSMKVALIGSDAQNPYTGGSGSGSVHTNAAISPQTALQNMGIQVTYNDGSDNSSAAAAAKAADVAIVFGHASSGEGHDRSDLNLEDGIDGVIPAVAAAQKNTVVVMAVPGSILTPWRDDVPAILLTMFPGEQYGNAIGDVLFGAIPPQAKLPVTLPNIDNEQNMTEHQYPGLKTDGGYLEPTYTEGQIVGYRFYDKKNITPAFPFGHGLTYGEFTYSGMMVSGRTISFTVERTSGTGCDTPQVYISYPTADSDPKVPAKVLRYFKKTCESKTDISYTLTDMDVSNWNVDKKAYTVTSGTYQVHVGASSKDIRLSGSLKV